MSKSLRNKSTRFSRDGAFWGVSLCFLLSGIAGLVYQMVWMRYLSTIFGTSELAIVTVLVAYMGGLAVGAAVASRFAHSFKNPIRVYAILEGVIAISALLVPFLLRAVSGFHRVILGGQDAPPSDGGVLEALAFLGLGSLVLLIPTACMGATLPILASGVVRRAAQIGKRVGWLYAINTFGAVGGTVLAAFYLIPNLGLWQTSFVGVGLNLTVAVLGWFVALRVPKPADKVSAAKSVKDGEEKRSESPPAQARSFTLVILGVMLLSGSLSFAYEVLWSRLLAHALGGSLYAFATMLAAFLGGIALGGLGGAWLAVNQRRSCFWLAGVEIAAGVLSALLFLYVSSTGFSETAWEEASLGSLARTCALLLMPATLCMGATFPLAVRSLTADPRQAGRSAGRVYSWNTIGAIFGAVGAGYFLIPALGYAQTFKWAIVGNLLLGTLVLLLMTPRAKVPALLASLLTLAFVFAFHPTPPLRLLTMSPHTARPQKGKEPKLIFHAVGRSASVAVLERSGSFYLRTNGLPEAEVFAKGADKLSYTRIRWLPALPKVLRPKTRSLLVVGFGGGALLEAIPSGIESVDVVELEAEVIRANKLIADRRAIDPFRDPRINVIVNDVRGALRLTTRRYDAIVSQPSHPWTAGASHLYTREFLELAREHLHEEGTFVQWLGAHFVDEDLLRSFCATMRAVYDHTQLYLVGDNFVFVGSGAPLDDGFLEGAGPGGSLIHLSDYPKISYVEDVLSVLLLDEDGCRRLAAAHSVITDNRNRMATHQSLGKRRAGAMSERENLVGVLAPLHYLNQPSPALLQVPAARSIVYPYFTGLLIAGGIHLLDEKRINNVVLPPSALLVNQARVLASRDPHRALGILQRAHALQPDDALARALEVQLRIRMARRSWVARGLGPSPREFGDLIADEEALRAGLAKLPPAQQVVAEAEHWLLTGQLARLPAVEKTMRTFVDHRDPFYQTAAQVRLRTLLDPASKSEAQQEVDARRAADLLDHLLSLPLVTDYSLINQRLQLAQRFGDIAYQIAAGWIMARKIASAPPNTPAGRKKPYQSRLGAILKPYTTRNPNGRLHFTNREISRFYAEVAKQLGVGVFPAEYQQ